MEIFVQSAEIDLECIPLRLEQFLTCLGYFKNSYFFLKMKSAICFAPSPPPILLRHHLFLLKFFEMCINII